MDVLTEMMFYLGYMVGGLESAKADPPLSLRDISPRRAGGERIALV